LTQVRSGRWGEWLQVAGIVGAAALFAVVLRHAGQVQGQDQKWGVRALPPVQTEWRVSFLALGDINLGRGVGQRILQGDTLFPFAAVVDTLRSYDVVFANLESNISDQNGRTEHPRNNIVFTAPPAAAQALHRAGITVVATANNHALDFGVSALAQTVAYLDSAGVAHAGTGKGDLYRPAIIRVRGVRIAVFAVTDIMNATGEGWKNFVASADTAALLPAVRAVRDSVDAVILSYHGGDEYAGRATRRTRGFVRDVLRGGVDLFIGHHPHVPYGLDAVGGRLAAHSLGNFVFRQPDRYWTRFGFALSAVIVKDTAGTRMEAVRCLPLRADFQPAFLSGGEDAARVLGRIRLLSTVEASEKLAW
jgi:hypothetical protein